MFPRGRFFFYYFFFSYKETGAVKGSIFLINFTSTSQTQAVSTLKEELAKGPSLPPGGLSAAPRRGREMVSVGEEQRNGNSIVKDKDKM